MSQFKVNNIWYYKFTHEGHQIKRSAGKGATRKDAKELERKLHKELIRDSLLIKRGIPVNRTYGDAALKFVNEKYLKESMKSHFKAVLPYLINVPLSETHLEVRNMAVDMASDSNGKALKLNTINRRIAIVKRVLTVAYNQWDGWLEKPTAQKIEKFNESKYDRHYYFTEEQVKEFVDAMPDDEIKPWFLLLAYTGMRHGELLSLTSDHWDGSCVLLGTNTKSGKPRSVPVIESQKYLMNQLPCPFTYQDFRRNWEAARKMTGETHWRIHDLRHTYASWLAKNPAVPMTAIRDILGHSNLGVTSRYSHLSNSVIIDATSHLSSTENSNPSVTLDSCTKSRTTTTGGNIEIIY